MLGIRILLGAAAFTALVASSSAALAEPPPQCPAGGSAKCLKTSCTLTNPPRCECTQWSDCAITGGTKQGTRLQSTPVNRYPQRTSR